MNRKDSNACAYVKKEYENCNGHDLKNFNKTQKNKKKNILIISICIVLVHFCCAFLFCWSIRHVRIVTRFLNWHNGFQIFNASDMAIHSVCNYIIYVIWIEKYFVFRLSSNTETFLNNNGGSDGGNNNNNIDRNCLLCRQPITEICDAKQ